MCHKPPTPNHDVMMFALSGVFALRVTCIVDSEESRPRNARPEILVYIYIYIIYTQTSVNPRISILGEKWTRVA